MAPGFTHPGGPQNLKIAKIRILAEGKAPTEHHAQSVPVQVSRPRNPKIFNYFLTKQNRITRNSGYSERPKILVVHVITHPLSSDAYFERVLKEK